MAKTLDIILPIYNPSADWYQALKSSDQVWEAALDDVKIRYIIVDDGSRQALDTPTLEAIKDGLHGEVLYHRYTDNGGKGKAVREGALQSDADVLVYTDHDIPYLDQYLVEFYHLVAKDQADLVLCYRDDSYYEQAPLIRRIISRVLKSMIRTMVQIPTTDTQGGLKALSPAARMRLQQCKTDSYLFDLELVKRCHRDGLRIDSKPVQIRDGLVFSKMGVSLLFRELGAFCRILFS